MTQSLTQNSPDVKSVRVVGKIQFLVIVSDVFSTFFFRLIALTEELLLKRCKVASLEHIVVS